MKKNVLGVISLLSVVILVSACGGGNANNNSQQVEELQKQVEELKRQVEQNNQSNTVSQQPVQQQVQQTQPIQPIQQNQVPQQPYGQQNVNVSVETAKATAVSHAGLDINQVTFVKQAYDFDDGMQEWDIDFVYGTTKYEYTINAMTGAIMKFEVGSIYD